MSDPFLANLSSMAEHFAGLPISGSSMVQLEKGPLALLSLKLTGTDLVAVRLQMAPLSIGTIAINRGWCCFMYPLRWSGDYRFNGALAEPGDIFLASTQEGYATVSRKRSTLAIGLRKEKLRNLISVRSGIAPETLDLGDRKFSAIPGAEAFCADFIALGHRLTASIAGMDNHRVIGDRAEAILLNRFIDFHEQILLKDTARHGLAVDSRACIRRVEASLETLERVPRTLNELCDLSGVGKTRLSYAFNDIYGFSPVRFLRLRALATVHQRLADTENPVPSVKYVALEHGFLNKGRFSAEYQQIFGELPSTTLARARAGLRRRRAT